MCIVPYVAVRESDESAKVVPALHRVQAMVATTICLAIGCNVDTQEGSIMGFKWVTFIFFNYIYRKKENNNSQER